MKRTRGKKMIVLLGTIALLVVGAFVAQREVKRQPVSAFGRYQGYTEAIYDGAQRTSDYLMLPDGTRLAYDLILPTKNGVPRGTATALYPWFGLLSMKRLESIQ